MSGRKKSKHETEMKSRGSKNKGQYSTNAHRRMDSKNIHIAQITWILRRFHKVSGIVSVVTSVTSKIPFPLEPNKISGE